MRMRSKSASSSAKVVQFKIEVWKMSWYQSEAEAKAATERAKATILAEVPAWKAKGISEVKCLYDGTGDEGSISGFEFDENSVEDSEISDAVRDAFEELTFAEVTGDNEGGGGEIVVNLRKNKTPKITRSEYYYQTERVDVNSKPEVL